MPRDVQLGPALVAHRIKEMDGELKELVARAPPEKAVRPLAETGPRDLTFEEKRKLSIVRFAECRRSIAFDPVLPCCGNPLAASVSHLNRPHSYSE